jgi:hypothetical protein
MNRPVPRSVRWVASAFAGLAVAVILHYMLYRIGIPLKPFIYVMF